MSLSISKTKAREQRDEQKNDRIKGDLDIDTKLSLLMKSLTDFYRNSIFASKEVFSVD